MYNSTSTRHSGTTYVRRPFGPCRCCGKEAFRFPGEERMPEVIHTRCIPKHWGKHSKGINASRCKEFSGQPGLNKVWKD